MLPIYVINLARRKDRLAHMTDELDTAGLAFIRVEAVDAQSANPDWVDSQFALPHSLELSSGDKACAMSHFRAYEAFLSSAEFASASHAVILEDDIRLSKDAGPLLSSCEWLPEATRLLKLERFFRTRPVLTGRPRSIGARGGSKIAPLLSKHLGAAGYIISRATAKAILAIDPKPYVPMDQLLFNPGRSPIFYWLKPDQLMPALVRQEFEVSDIKSTWDDPSVWTKVKREAARFFGQTKLVPLIAAELARGGLRLSSVDFHPRYTS
jgi:glycosyl transferase family 25